MFMKDDLNNDDIKKQICDILKVIRDTEDGIEILETIFDCHIKESDEEELIKNIVFHAKESFNYDFSIILMYFSKQEFLSEKDINDSSLIESLHILNKLKRKYGYILNTIQRSSGVNSFLLKTITLSGSLDSQVCTLFLKRNDNEKFSLMLNSENLLTIHTLSAQALDTMIDNKVYNFNIEALITYLKESQKVLNKISNIVDDFEKATNK